MLGFSAFSEMAILELPSGARVSSLSVSPSTIPANHAGEIELVLTGTETTWLDNSEVFSVSGVDSVVKTRQVIRSNTDASVFVRTV